jgi:hypothetical protein
MNEGSIHGRLFCAAGATLLSSLSCAVFLAANPSKSSATTLQWRVSAPVQGENSIDSRPKSPIGVIAG